MVILICFSWVFWDVLARSLHSSDTHNSLKLHESLKKNKKNRLKILTNRISPITSSSEVFMSEPAGCRLVSDLCEINHSLIKPGCLWYQDRQTLRGNVTYFKSLQVFLLKTLLFCMHVCVFVKVRTTLWIRLLCRWLVSFFSCEFIPLRFIMVLC